MFKEFSHVARNVALVMIVLLVAISFVLNIVIRPGPYAATPTLTASISSTFNTPEFEAHIETKFGLLEWEIPSFGYIIPEAKRKLCLLPGVVLTSDPIYIQNDGPYRFQYDLKPIDVYTFVYIKISPKDGGPVTDIPLLYVGGMLQGKCFDVTEYVFPRIVQWKTVPLATPTKGV